MCVVCVSVCVCVGVCRCMSVCVVCVVYACVCRCVCVRVLFHRLYTAHFHYPVSVDEQQGLFHIWPIVNWAYINKSIQVTLSYVDFISFKYTSRNRVSKSYGRSSLYFWEKTSYLLPRWLYQCVLPLTVYHSTFFHISISTCYFCLNFGMIGLRWNKLPEIFQFNLSRGWWSSASFHVSIARFCSSFEKCLSLCFAWF